MSKHSNSNSKNSSNLKPLNINNIRNPRGITIAEKITSLEEQRTRVRELFAKLDLALAKQKITMQEYEYLLQKYSAGNHEYKLLQAIDKRMNSLLEKKNSSRLNNKYSSLSGIAIISIALMLILVTGTLIFNSNSGITGFGTYVDKVIRQTNTIEITQNTTLSVNITNITSVKLTGSVKGLGTAKAYLLLGTEKLLITEQSTLSQQQSSLVKTDKSTYLTGETIRVEVEGATIASQDTIVETNNTNSTNSTITNTEEATYTLYAKSDTETKSLTSNEFSLDEPGFYEIYTLIDNQGTISKESIFIQVATSLDEITKTFEASCDSTCNLDPNKIPLGIEVSLEGTSLIIDEITYTTKAENSIPIQIKEFQDLNLTNSMSTTIDLNNYFEDPDGQELIFDEASQPGAGLSITNNLLTINPQQAGNYQVIIYASDLNEMIESNEFTINILEPELELNNSNNTINDSSNETNQTLIVEEILDKILLNNTENNTNNNVSLPINETNSSVEKLKALGLCNYPDPNKRPASCLIEDSEYYFTEEGKFLENLDKKKVARITPIGNFLITGEVYEHSSGEPGKRDFKIGYTDDNFEFIPTLWVSSETGDLYLKGSLNEEVINLELPSNVYSFQNKRGVNLGFVNPKTGDLFIRGNLIPYRRSIE